MFTINRLASKAIRTSINIRRYVSALYVPNDKATEHCVAVHPYMDYENVLFKRRPALEVSIEKRHLSNNIANIIEKYESYKKIINEMTAIELEREKVVQALKKLNDVSKKSNTPLDQHEIARLKDKGKKLRNELRTTKEEMHKIEDSLAQSYLSLPNELHPMCPQYGVDKVIYSSPLTPKMNSIPHLERTELIKYISSDCYYLFDEAAEFDVHALHNLASIFVRQGNFVQTSNPDFVRKVLLEANGTTDDEYHQVMERNLLNEFNAAHLCGGGAFESYLGNFTKLCIYPSVLPLRFVSCGRQYKKTAEKQRSGNLYGALQTNTVQTCVVTSTAKDADAEMEQILMLTTDFYKTLGLHFRVVYVDASRLPLSENLRIAIEVYSHAEKRYVSVGHISQYSDFVSKRILFCTRNQKSYQFLHIIGGPIMHTTPLLAALIESGVSLNTIGNVGKTDKKEKA